MRGYIIYEKPEMLARFNTLGNENRVIEKELLASADDAKKSGVGAINTGAR